MFPKDIPDDYKTILQQLTPTGSRVYGNAKENSDYDFLNFVRCNSFRAKTNKDMLAAVTNSIFPNTNSTIGDDTAYIALNDGTLITLNVLSSGRYDDSNFFVVYDSKNDIHFITYYHYHNFVYACAATQVLKEKIQSGVPTSINHKRLFNVYFTLMAEFETTNIAEIVELIDPSDPFTKIDIDNLASMPEIAF